MIGGITKTQQVWRIGSEAIDTLLIMASTLFPFPVTLIHNATIIDLLVVARGRPIIYFLLDSNTGKGDLGLLYVTTIKKGWLLHWFFGSPSDFEYY